MEKQKTEKPLREHIEELRDRPRLRELADSLKCWNLTPEALVFTRRGHSLAMHENAVRQLEELGRMSTKIGEEVCELYAFGVGDVAGRSTFVEKLVLPSPERILVLRREGDIEVAKARESRTLLEEYTKAEEGVARDMPSLLRRVVNKKKEKDVELLKKFENRFQEMFVREVTPDEILNTPWEMISSPLRVENTKYYKEKVMNAGIPVFGVHIHLNSLKPSPFDIYVDAGPKQRIEWTGILLARRESWWDFRIGENNFAVYYSDIDNPKWLREIVARFSDEEFSQPFWFQADFVRESRARMMRYGELLQKIG